MYLEHYGVKGMKWGVRRTPEELGHHKARKREKVGYKPLRYQTEGERQVKRFLKRLGHQSLAYLIPGYGIAYNVNAIRATMSYSVDKKDYTKLDGEIEKPSQFTKKKNDKGVMDDLRKVNKRGLDPYKAGTVNNCVNCSMAMECRRRGYDVKARRRAYGLTIDQYSKYFKNTKVVYTNTVREPEESFANYAKRSYASLCQSIEKNGPGARGVLSLSWKNANSGHAVFFEVNKNGDVSFYDAQSQKVNDRSTFSLADPASYRYMRLDNLKMSDSIGEAVVSVDIKQKQKQQSTGG